MSCIIAVVSLAVCCTIDFVSFPSSRKDVHEGIVGKYNTSRTIVYYSDRIADIFHFTIDALNPVIDLCYFVVDAVGERQDLRRCHPNFLLRQFVQLFERILDIRLS